MNITLTQALHRAAQQAPRQTASRFGARTRSYAQLIDRVARLGAALRTLGVQPGDRVGMLSLNSDRYLEFYYATWWAGAVVNPVNVRWSAAEIAFSLVDCDTQVLIVDEHFGSLVPQLRERVPQLRELVRAGEGAQPPAGMHDYEALVAGARPIEDQCVGGDALAAVFYTGGTTGQPKGVMLSHANLWCSGIARMAQVHSPFGSTAIHVAPLFHMASAGRLLTQFTMAGESVILPTFDPETLIECIERHQVREITLVPSMIQMLLDAPAFAPARLGSLQRITYGASPIAELLLDRALAALPGVEFTQSYGQTEAAPVITLNPPESHAAEGRRLGRLGRLRAAGRASYSMHVRIEDPQGNEVPRGQVGEICARGPNVMLGYWNRPEETAHALRGGWLHTGDGGYMDEDGYVFVVDRLKDMIVSGGENVYSAEVENAARQHPGVADCAVIGIPSAKWGESVHIAVVLQPRAQLDLEGLQAHCRTLIAGYKVPRSMEVLPALPLSPVGKVLKTTLRQPYWSGAGRSVN